MAVYALRLKFLVNWHLLDSGVNTSANASLGLTRNLHAAQGAVEGLCLPTSHGSRRAAWWLPAGRH
jgi:hypothetical protein